MIRTGEYPTALVSGKASPSCQNLGVVASILFNLLRLSKVSNLSMERSKRHHVHRSERILTKPSPVPIMEWMCYLLHHPR